MNGRNGFYSSSQNQSGGYSSSGPGSNQYVSTSSQPHSSYSSYSSSGTGPQQQVSYSTSHPTMWSTSHYHNRRANQFDNYDQRQTECCKII